MKTGDVLRDNDPRMGPRRLTITSLGLVTERGPERVCAKDRHGREFWISAKRIYADGKQRRTGFDLESE